MVFGGVSAVNDARDSVDLLGILLARANLEAPRMLTGREDPRVFVAS